MGERGGVAFSGQRPLVGIDGEETAIEIAVLHPRDIELRQVGRQAVPVGEAPSFARKIHRRVEMGVERQQPAVQRRLGGRGRLTRRARSEEHTSELQSLMRISYAVFCLKKKKHKEAKTILTYNKTMKY